MYPTPGMITGKKTDAETSARPRKCIRWVA
jgi:hypothetical protein